MKLRFNIAIISLIVLLFSFSCKNPKKQDSSNQVKTFHDTFDWLVGSWVLETNDFIMYETWDYGDGDVFNAYSYVVVGDDTVFSENVKLHKMYFDFIEDMDSVVYYEVSVPDQNRGESVRFELLDQEDEKVFVFENMYHDFPQRIVYKNVAKDTLYAYIEGEQNGEYRREDFEFVRVK